MGAARGMSKSGIMEFLIRVDGERARNGEVRQGWACGVPRTHQRVKVDRKTKGG